MSKSRLEKFLYALYSLDSSDLPNPLSRIEELYKCLVTGEEAPSFEPISRVEKYLMAILGVYDVNELPNPISRVEVLLHKLAIGDDDLDDVKSFLSEHEELLAEIIRNGGDGGNIDIEYVLYTLSTEFNTLYNTAEKPVKSAILKGQTLVNLSKQKSITVTSTTSSYSWTNSQIKLDSNLFKAGQKYLFTSKYSYTNKAFDNKTTIYFILRKNGETTEKAFLQTAGKGIFTIPTNFETTDTLLMRVHASIGTAIDNTVTCDDIKIIEYQDGMENWDIPYFEGMQSVKMPVLTTSNGGNVINNDMWMVGRLDSTTGGILSGNQMITDFIKKPYNVVEFSTIGGSVYNVIFEYDANKNFIKATGGATNSLVLTLASNTEFIKLNVQNPIGSLETHQPMLTSGGRNELKSNILTLNEEVELCGIGEGSNRVEDDLNLLTGELTQRIGESNSENFAEHYYSMELFNGYCAAVIELNNKNKALSSAIKTNLVPTTQSFSNGLDCGIYNNPDNVVVFKKGTSLEEFKNFVSNLIIQYQLETPTVLTVDLSVVDQDGNDTELSTFDDITHVTLSSEVLIPVAELEVATKNEEVLNTLSLEMDDISTSQNTLEETANTQSENVDATMIATTEIYEDLL